jgi:acyl carrier protein
VTPSNESDHENDAKLRSLLVDVFLMDEALYRDENGPDQIAGWDSLATVSMAVGVHETFGHHMTPQDVAKVKTIGDIKAYLRRQGVAL